MSLEISADFALSTAPVIAPFTSSEGSESPIIIDPRQRPKFIKHDSTSAFELKPETTHYDTVNLPSIPLRYVLESLSKNIKKSRFIINYRIIKIDNRLLDILRRISPKDLGGTMETQKHEIREMETNSFAQRRNAWVRRLSPYFDSADLIELYKIVREITDGLSISLWKCPKHHHNFNTDGGWEVYILKLHQLIIACMSKDAPTKFKGQNKGDQTKIEPEKSTSDDIDPTSSLSPLTTSHVQSNVYESRTLWNLAVRAATNDEHGDQSTECYGDNFYRDYHQSLRLTTSSISADGLTTPSTTANDGRNTRNTATPTASGLSPIGAARRIDSDPEDTPINPPVLENIRNIPAVVQHDENIPMEIYITLMDGASSYQQLPSIHNAQAIMAICDPPVDKTTGKPAIVSYVYSNVMYRRALICLDLDLLSFDITSGGRYEAYLWALFIETIRDQVTAMHWHLQLPAFLKSKEMVERRALHALRVFRACMLEERWSITKIEYLCHILMSSSPSAMNDTMNELVTHIWHSAFHRNDFQGLKRLEGVLVALLGHSDVKVRGRAAVLLNMFYDRHDWQVDVPFVPVIKEIGDVFEVTVCVDDGANPTKGETPQGVALILSAPSFDPESPYDCYSYHTIDWLPMESLKGKISGMSRFSGTMAYGRSCAPVARHRWIGTVKFQNFTRCGFFDWRVVKINEDFGSWETVQAALNDIRRSTSSSRLLDLRISLSPEDLEASPDSVGDKDQMVIGKVYPHPQRMAEVLKGLLSPNSLPMFCNEDRQTFPLQGRFIVQSRGMSDEQVHEIFIDQHGCEFDKQTGRLSHRGSFASITSSLSELRDKGVTMIYLMGALSRDNGEMQFLSHGGITFQREDAPPFAVTCRCTPSAMAGGACGLQALLKEARRVGIKVVVDSFTRVSSSRAHRKYEPYLLSHIDSEGKKQVLYGSGGRASNYEDTVQLNYRKVECWDLLISDMKIMSTVYCVDGLRLENCQSWPPILSSDTDELQRRDPDGTFHYNIMEQLLANVVVPLSEDSCGFWGSKGARKWANPFLVKLCKEVWKSHPEFVLIGECFGSDRGNDRQSVLARSGVIPQLQDMPEPLAKIFGHEINEEDSSVTPCTPSNVQEIINWFDSAHNDLPEGAIVIQSSCSHLSPLPGLLYGRGAWPAVDLLFFLPDIPSTFSGEMEGSCFRLDITNVFTATAVKTVEPVEDVKTSDETIPSRLLSYRSTAARSLVNLLDESSPIPPVRACSRSSGPKPLCAFRTLAKFEPIVSLAKLEEEQIKKIGPEFGFDLKQISGHYEHRRRLRHRLKIIRSGILVPLNARHQGQWHPRVLAFLRFDPETGEFVLVGINFSEYQLDEVSISLKALGFQFRDMGLESTTMFVSADLFAITQSEGMAQDRSDSKLHRIGSHRDLGEVPLMGGQNTLGKIFKFSQLYDEVYSMAELLYKPQVINLKAYGSVCLGFKPVEQNELTKEMLTRLYSSSLCRLQMIVKGTAFSAVFRNEPIPQTLEKILRFNFSMESIISSILDNDLTRFLSVLVNLREGLNSLASTPERQSISLHDLIVDSGLFCSEAQRFDPASWMRLCCREKGGAASVLAQKDERTDMAERLVAKMMVTESKIEALGCSVSPLLEGVREFAHQFVDSNNIGPIVFVTTELGKWSTVGGLGVMVDELSCTLAEHLGQTVYIVTPYYNFDRKGNPARMDPNEVQYKSNISVMVGGESIELGVHEGRVRGVNLIFLHNARFFPHPYPNWNVPDGLRSLSLIGKSALEVLCQKRLIPQLIVTNDWPTGLVAAYGKNPHFFSDSFRSTTFFHIVHNLDSNYEGRLYADRGSNYGWITELSNDFLIDPSWQNFLYNPSRCALLCSDAWGTVSPSYRDELRRPGGSALAPLLNRYPTPFAYPNGIPLKSRLERLNELPYKSHEEGKAEIQRKYFKFEEADLTIPLFAFIGRITEQKGVHHIVDAAEQLIQRYQCKIQILIGGKVTWNDPYSAYCGHKMEYLRNKYPFSVWASPNEFFNDGPLINIGADVALMPSKFEPGGIVQHEFFIAGTPVLAFRTGGLRDTVYEFDIEKHTGNGFTFEAFQMGDFLYAMERAHRVVSDPLKYQKLRENAKYSVISCEQVAQAWLIEFCRLRRKLPVNYARLDELSKKYSQTWDPLNWNATYTSGSIDVPLRRSSVANSLNEVKPLQDNRKPNEGNTQGSSGTSGSMTRRSKTEKPGLVPVRIRFCPKSGNHPRVVLVSGSFDGWQVRRPLVWDNALQAFSINFALRPGRYVYKLMVDGNWTLNPDGLSEQDLSGNSNNLLLVE